MGKTDFSNAISTWKHDEGKDIKQEPLYSSRHESTPSSVALVRPCDLSDIAMCG